LRFSGHDARTSDGEAVDQQTQYKPELLCPRCGYNVIVQVELRIGRCPECGDELPNIEPNNKVAWDIWAGQRRREVRGY